MSTTVPIGTGSGGGFPPARFLGRYSGDDARERRLLRRYRLGLAMFLVVTVMLFVGFSSAYVVRRGVPTYDAASGTYSATWEPLRLPIGLLIVNTFVLLSATGTVEIARRWNRRKPVLSGVLAGRDCSRWIYASFALIMLFIAGQAFAWRMTWGHGHFLNTGARAGFFYVFTGTHAIHVVAGLLLLGWLMLFHSRRSSALRMVVDLTAWYLHFMTALWVYLLCFLALA